MATVKVTQIRAQSSTFGLYRTSAGGDESIIVRRKVGEPTDVEHTKSRKLKKQRDNLALASQHYAQLTPSQKAITRHQIEDVEYQQSHGKTDTKLLMGRQLFISKEIHSLETTQKQLVLPLELCIMLVGESMNPLEGTLTLEYLNNGEWFTTDGVELSKGNWLFSRVPRAMDAYRIYGTAEYYLDPQLPEHQNMSESYIKTYHYHKLQLLAPHTVFQSLPQDGMVYSALEPTYGAAHQATHGELVNTDSMILSAFNQRYLDNYRIERAFLYFDTSSLGVLKIIDTATLQIYFMHAVNVEIDPGQATLHVVEGVQGDPLMLIDYGDHRDMTVSGGDLSLNDTVLDQFNDLPLNATGISWINKVGITRFCLRLAGDINAAVPTGFNVRSMYGGNSPTGLKLLVTYHIF